MRRLPRWLLAVILAACAGPGAAYAAWSGTGATVGQVQAATMPAGTAPTVSATGHSVTVSWTGGTLLGQSLNGYTVKRYNAAGVSQTVSSGCSGTIAALSCTESSVPAGIWTYTVTPLLYSWLGTASSASSAVTVQAPGLSITSATTVTSLPATVSASLTGYTAGQTVTFKLDSATGTTLTSTLSPTSIPAGGSATATITLPAATAEGAHTIYAVGSQGDSASATVTVNRPVVSGAVIAKSAGGVSGAIKQGGTYYVYANATGSGTPPAGLAGLTADVSTVTTGETAAALSSGSYTIGGQSYNHRSAQLTAKSTLSAGSDAFTVKLTDSAGTATTTSYSVTVDNTAPRASNIQTANVSGGTAGKPELGDTVMYTFSEPIDPDTVLSGWDGSAKSVIVAILDGGSSSDDTLDVLDASTLAALPLGTIDLGRKDYLSKTTAFGASGTASTMVLSGSVITVTLGTPTSTAETAAGTGTLAWTPSSTVTDLAGNAMSTTAVNETGTADKDF
ncbi:MAG TPA: hypothetical protein VHW96_05600 [Solirubrobacteraceae bacterium]|jgi:hypothetical protein|nr:hypothetical protein [Solirubrobacteraceae bacterium]